MLACLIDKFTPGLVKPMPEAHKKGFVILRYRSTDARELCLEIHPALNVHTYKWTQTVDGMPRSFSCAHNEQDELLQSFRAVFGDTEQARMKHKAAA